jgi:WD40 repeat protein
MIFEGKVGEPSGEAVLISEAKHTLFGHNNRIIGLQWSPHDSNKLVSVSFDGTSRVSLKYRYLTFWLAGTTVLNYEG